MYDINTIRVNTNCTDVDSLKLTIILQHILEDYEEYEEYEEEWETWHIE